MTPAIAADPALAERFFWRALIVTGAVKLALALAVPFTTDEAYFALWGRHLDYGYYDHGAMTGWWTWFMLLFGDAEWWLRVPAVVVSQFVGWALWRMLRPFDSAKASWAAALYLVSPVNLFSFPITTDTPLLFFSVVAVMFVLRGVQRGRLVDYFAGGLALGFAFLSKYFAVLLGVSFAVVLLGCLGRPRVRELTVLLSGIVPGVGINVAWNYHHSWTNVLFNLYTRQEKSGFSVVPPLLFIGVIAALAGPGVIRALVQRQKHQAIAPSSAWRAMRTDGTIVLAAVFAIPMTGFLIVAFFHKIGVHWVLSFFPFLAAVLFLFFGAEGVRRMIRPTAIFTAIPTLFVVGLCLLPVDWAQKHRSAFSIVLAFEPDEILTEISPYRPRYTLTTTSYAKAALLGFHEGRNVPVLGLGSFHARQDDLITDLRLFAGRDVMILADLEKDFGNARQWFAQAEIKTHSVRGAKFFVLLGQGFNYALYREQVLQPIADRYYRMPPWLKRFAGLSYFHERYDLPSQSPP